MENHGTYTPGSALITGGSRGLGRALAELLALNGSRVVLVARDAAALDQSVSTIRHRLREECAPGEVHGISADIADKAAIYPLAAAAAARVGPIDLLVHNASTLGPTPLRLLLDTECEELERVLAVNLVGPFRLSKVIAGAMAVRGGGTILHVSSDAAVSAYPRWGAYSASKAAQDQLARVLAEELAAFSVRVLSVDPGEMDTAMHRAALPDADPNSLLAPDTVARQILRLLADPKLKTGQRALASDYGAAA